MAENPVTTTPDPHLVEAMTIIEELRSLRQRIPNFAFPSTSSETRRLSSAASVSKEFVDLSLLAMKNSQALVRGGTSDPAVSRDIVSYAEAYGMVASQLEELATFVRHSVTAAMNKVGHEALTTYALAQRLAKRPETADLAPIVRDMRKALGPRGRKTKLPPEPINPGPILPLTIEPEKKR